MSQPKESSLCTPHGELIEFLEGVAFQDLWNGRARDKFRAIVEVLKAAPSEKTPTELGAALKAKLDEAAPSAIEPNFYARCRPAVQAWVRKCERDVENQEFPEHYGPVLREARDNAYKLLDEIDTSLGLLAHG